MGLDSFEFVKRLGRQVGLAAMGTADRGNVPNEKLGRPATVASGHPSQLGPFLPQKSQMMPSCAMFQIL